MKINKSSFSVKSSDNIHTLQGVVYFPEKDIKGFFHIVHGMKEHIGRYEKIMTDLAEHGFITFGYDNLGHGKTAEAERDWGYIAKKNGWEILSKDVSIFSSEVIKRYTPTSDKLPYFLMGHSMGSFIARIAAEKYVTPDKLIIMGTCGKNPAAGAGLALISLIKKFKGDKHHSPLIDKLAFGGYNKRFGKASKDDSVVWFTSDESVRKTYYNDKYCNFNFSVSAMGDLIRLIKECNRNEWYKNVGGKMPVLLISGEEDPVGNYGKGIIEVRDNLIKQKSDVTCILYKNARHEIINDFTYETVKKDIIAFVEKG
jgi:alpha-beta hydrolase superfamily lysophospholipase